jgi:hypothetical protein
MIAVVAKCSYSVEVPTVMLPRVLTGWADARVLVLNAPTQVFTLGFTAKDFWMMRWTTNTVCIHLKLRVTLKLVLLMSLNLVRFLEEPRRMQGVLDVRKRIVKSGGREERPLASTRRNKKLSLLKKVTGESKGKSSTSNRLRRCSRMLKLTKLSE